MAQESQARVGCRVGVRSLNQRCLCRTQSIRRFVFILRMQVLIAEDAADGDVDVAISITGRVLDAQVPPLLRPSSTFKLSFIAHR